MMVDLISPTYHLITLTNLPSSFFSGDVGYFDLTIDKRDEDWDYPADEGDEVLMMR